MAACSAPHTTTLTDGCPLAGSLPGEMCVSPSFGRWNVSPRNLYTAASVVCPCPAWGVYGPGKDGGSVDIMALECSPAF